MAQKPSTPKGTRDFNPEQVAKRNYIFSTIKSEFQKFGFQPIETPSFENSSTLMGKYGEEGDRLIFKILNSGDYYNKFNKAMTELFRELYKILIKKLVENRRINIDELLFSFQIESNQSFFSSLNEILGEELDREFENKPIVDRIFYDSAFGVLSWNQSEIIEIVDKFKTLEELEYNTEYHDFCTDKALQAFGLWSREASSNKVVNYISEKALRYDLTVPFARYVVQHQNEIEFPFKRYQIQPVWRADRPQKGRFREFFQCDADVVGSKSLWQEVEFVQLYDNVFSALNLKGTTIKINNRKILSGIAEVIGASDKLIDFTVALDKLDKIGEEKVKEEMLTKGIPQEGIDKLLPLFSISGEFGSQIESLKDILSTSEDGKKGIEELAFINDAISTLGLKTATLQLDVTLARGLNYYTGAIFEVSAPEGVKMGSIGGGGRYDDLTGIFGLKDVSGVGISFGLDRIYLVLEELGLFPEAITKSTEVIFINFGDKEALFSLKAIKTLREAGINAELYPDMGKSGKQMKKQMNYANKREIPFVVLVGEQEMNANVYTLKNMNLGEQSKVSLEELIASVKG